MILLPPRSYSANIEGKLTIHGVTRDISEQGTFKATENSILGKSEFTIKVADYDIKIPRAVVKNIAEEIKIDVDVDLKVL